MRDRRAPHLVRRTCRRCFPSSSHRRSIRSSSSRYFTARTTRRPKSSARGARRTKPARCDGEWVSSGTEEVRPRAVDRTRAQTAEHEGTRRAVLAGTAQHDLLRTGGFLIVGATAATLQTWYRATCSTPSRSGRGRCCARDARGRHGLLEQTLSSPPAWRAVPR